MPSLFFCWQPRYLRGYYHISFYSGLSKDAFYVCVQRLEFLAALEMAFQEQLPIGLQLAHVDRDFNE